MNELVINEKIEKMGTECEQELRDIFSKLDELAYFNTKKVLNAFKKHRVSEVHFNGSTGYGYDDVGRQVIEDVYKEIFKAEDALVRIQFVNGTHALSAALFGCTYPGKTLFSITGQPYDTLCETIGITNNSMSLMSYGVKYKQIELINNEFDEEKIIQTLQSDDISTVFIGRSRGYSTRASLTISKIEKIISKIKEVSPSTVVMVDNCYGEFVEDREPVEVGADIMAGSLIKNLGGGICRTGGYIVGREDLVKRAAERLTAPGIGKECGATLGENRNILQGLFLAPQSVKNAVKSAIFTARLLEKMGYVVSPKSTEERTDIIQSIEFGEADKLIKFIQGVQAASPVDSFVVPMPWAMPGYTDEVIMAAGTFISGASIELSADAPIKPPYLAYMQGGLTYESAKLAILNAISNVGEN